MQRFVEAKIAVPGLHRWPLAPARLSHLRDYHRHLFVIRFAKPVSHDDRDIEFQELAAQVKSHLVATYHDLQSDGYAIDGVNFRHRSCEAIAEDLIKTFDLAWCSVHEDDEHGAMVIA